MSDEITAEDIATTQSLLSKHIKKPPLTEKLLRKPPFRFIHDVISTIIKETGFLKGLYSKEDLNPENIKDKEGKVVFLKKLIYAINYSTDVQIVVHPQKIVAGLDVMKTNELLQALAKALDKKIDSTDAVKHALKMVEKESTQSNTSKKLHNNLKKENIKSNPKKSVQAITERNNKDNEGSHPATEKKIKGSERKETKGKKLNQSPPKKNRISKEPTASSHTLTNPESTDHDVKNNVIGSTEPSDTSDTQTLIKQSLVAKIDHINQEEKSNHGYLKDDKTTNSNSGEQEFKNNVQGDNSPKRTLSNKAVEKQLINQDYSQGDSIEYFVDRRGDIINEPVEKNQISSSLSDVVSAEVGKGQRTSIRPASARPGAPRIHDKGLALSSHNDHKMAPDVVNLITDVNAMIKNDEESLVTVETVMTHMDIEKGHDQSHVARSEDQGHLVSQIIETKNELEDTGQDKMDIISDVNSSWTIQKENIISREVEHLQSALQKLTRGVNPIGKLIDFLQQDFESMLKELENWTITYQDSTKKLRNEEKVTKERMKPLIRQLEDISHLIQDQLEESTMVKAMIINNDETLDKHLKSHSLHHT